ncbi:hypothetical protein DFH94DRAFT_123553 [Russula ochroleuca]|uniref:Uncharacterized protein n=1 Tax=Russula ochroleuca TaxID=152965 RepID=A0A9P5JU76_9AGAM|nr:hypothetical protein DFH94DRAFT_123553 [Russula ochroleuca]
MFVLPTSVISSHNDLSALRTSLRILWIVYHVTKDGVRRKRVDCSTVAPLRLSSSRLITYHIIVSTLGVVLTDSDEKWLTAVYLQTRSSLDMCPSPLLPHHITLATSSILSRTTTFQCTSDSHPRRCAAKADNTPFECTCARSAHLTHGINRCPIYWPTLPNGTDKGRFYRLKTRGERSMGLSARLLLRGRNRAGGVA